MIGWCILISFWEHWWNTLITAFVLQWEVLIVSWMPGRFTYWNTLENLGLLTCPMPDLGSIFLIWGVTNWTVAVSKHLKSHWERFLSCLPQSQPCMCFCVPFEPALTNKYFLFRSVWFFYYLSYVWKRSLLHNLIQFITVIWIPMSVWSESPLFPINLRD